MLGDRARPGPSSPDGAAVSYAVCFGRPAATRRRTTPCRPSVQGDAVDALPCQTCDTAYVGATTSSKAPVLRLVTLPWFEVLRVVRLVPDDTSLHAGFPERCWGCPRRALWRVRLFWRGACELGLLILTGLVAGRIAPEPASRSQPQVGLGTLILPFATVVLRCSPRFSVAAVGVVSVVWKRPAAAGCLARAGRCCMDLPLTLVAAALAVYAGGVQFLIVGAVTVALLARLRHLGVQGRRSTSSEDLRSRPGRVGPRCTRRSRLRFGVGVPSLRSGRAAVLPRGLFMLSPVLVVALGGLWLLRLQQGVRARGGSRRWIALFLVRSRLYPAPL